MCAHKNEKVCTQNRTFQNERFLREKWQKMYDFIAKIQLFFSLKMLGIVKVNTRKHSDKY